ncbi:MAG: hypothetical protein AAFQ98_08635 [Bacteroidota bacterium]
MKKAHHFSGLFIALFAGLHLFNHLLSLGGIQQHLNSMAAMRQVYRHPILETALLLAVVLQITTGLRLWGRLRQKAHPFFVRLQLWSGLYLAMFLLIHVGAVLAGRWVFQLDTNFYFAAVGINTFPFNLFFIPYYLLAVLSVFAHLAAVHAQKMKRSWGTLTPKGQAQMLLALGAIVAVLILYGITGGFQGVEVPEEYGVMVGK